MSDGRVTDGGGPPGAGELSVVGGVVGSVLGARRGVAGAVVGGLVGGTGGYLVGALAGASDRRAGRSGEPVTIEVTPPERRDPDADADTG
jgi:hypothetical protein